ncbi:YciI family protein [Granulosicoccus antarcticus]|uniref:YCII-related domain-containing protein n=1 Tax=Granulosicoccus antarcticus IMCC3135 TaxID=1192854 RepID=A0A2Z2P126_9GAMM|nr:YciI family protein [Granulosicoccus antarcticus]ASJ76111.1 hypothetical protein IMCC3135_30310 [Granulosicoccus antarcticus IMCC3135]
MPAWNDYKKAAQERGSLALELYVVETTAVKPEQLADTLPAHLQYQLEQERSGALVFAGPLSDDTGEQMQGNGLIIYRAESMQAARAIADADPMHAAGVRTYTLRKWLVNEGSFQLNVTLSAQSVRM